MLGAPRTGGAPAVSVLVPTYNVERYLPECLDSLRAQTLRDLQVIVIDDGSTDASGEIADRYARMDPRFEVIHKPNSGYGASMNLGLERARGEYVGIVESDDFASPEMFRTYYRVARRHRLDLVKSNYFEHQGGESTRVKPFARLWCRRVFEPVERPDVIRILPIIWSGLYRRGLLEDEGIRFLETPGASYQDTGFVQKVWFSARRAMLLHGSYLHYRVDNPDSSVKSSAKVLEICGEFASTEEFLRRDPERFARFAPLLQSMKMATYKWNYNRIVPEARPGFMRRWREELLEAKGEGLLDQVLFSPIDWELAEGILADPDFRAGRYEEDLPW